MTNDTSTLSGALLEMKDQLIYELGQKGVTASYSSTDGLLGLISKIADIQQGGGGQNIVTFDDLTQTTFQIVTSAGNRVGSTFTVNVPNGVTTIGYSCFYSMKNLRSVTLPNTITTLGGYAFYRCENLTSLTIPPNVTNLPASCMRYCTGLTSLTIPSSVTNMESFAIADNTGLRSLKFERTTPPTLANNSLQNLHSDCVITVPVGCYYTYTNTSNYPSPNTYTYQVDGTYNLSFDSERYIIDNGNCTLTATLIDTDNNNAPVSGETLTLYYDGNITTATTNNNGVATFSLTNLVRGFTATVSVESVTATCNVIALGYSIHFSQSDYVGSNGTVVLTCTLLNSGEPVNDVTITLNGSDSSSYTCTTDSNGVATKTINSSSGILTFTATYNNVSDTCNVKILPLGYIPVEYLQSTGSQYINTEYVLKANDKVEVSFSSQGSLQYEAVFGARKNNYSQNAYLLFSRFGSQNKIVYNRTGQEKQGSNISLNTIYDVTCQGQTCTVKQNGSVVQTITTTGTVNDCVNPCGLFTLNTYNGTGFTKDYYSYMKIYSFIITNNNNEYERYMIPARNGNVGGMYDFVTNQFYHTYGTFSYGSDIYNTSTEIFTDNCTSDNTSQYTDSVEIGSGNTTMSISFDSQSNGYLVSSNGGGDYWRGKVIPTITGEDSIGISCDVKLLNTSAYNQFLIGVSDSLTHNSKSSFTADCFRIRGDNKVDYFHNTGSESWSQSNVSISNVWVTLKLIKQGTNIIGKLYDSNGTELATTTQTSNAYSNPYFFIAINTRYNSDTKYIKNIKVEQYS